MKNQVDKKVIIAAIAGVLLIVVLIGYFTLGNLTAAALLARKCRS